MSEPVVCACVPNRVTCTAHRLAPKAPPMPRCDKAGHGAMKCAECAWRDGFAAGLRARK